MSHECALKLTDLWNISLQLFDLNYKFEVVGASLWALAKSIYYPAFKMSNHLSCKPKGTLGKVVDEESTSVAHTGPIYTVNNMKVFSDLVTWREKQNTQRLLCERKFFRLVKGYKSWRIGRFYWGHRYTQGIWKAPLIFNEMQYSKVYTVFIPRTLVGLTLVLIPGDMFLQ